jgi:hypothetical protein
MLDQVGAEAIQRPARPRYSGRRPSNPRWLNSWLTLRTWRSSVSHIRAICGTGVWTFDANKIAARIRVD